MKKETLLSYGGKGVVNHKGYKINVTNDYLEKTKLHHLPIELIDMISDIAADYGVSLDGIEESR